MGRGFSLRDINNMSEKEAGIYFDKLPGFENLKRQLDEEQSDKPFFLDVPGLDLTEDPRTPTEKQAVVNPYTGETKYDKKPETLQEDGRVPHDDAKDLWRAGVDGARIHRGR